MSAALSPHAAQEILLAGREPGGDWLVPAKRGGLITLLMGALSRGGAESRATAARDDTYGDARLAPLAAEFAEPEAVAACLV